MPAKPNKQAGKRSRHFRIIRRLAGDSVPSAPVRKITDSTGIPIADLLRMLEFDQAAQRVSR